MYKICRAIERSDSSSADKSVQEATESAQPKKVPFLTKTQQSSSRFRFSDVGISPSASGGVSPSRSVSSEIQTRKRVTTERAANINSTHVCGKRRRESAGILLESLSTSQSPASKAVEASKDEGASKVEGAATQDAANISKNSKLHGRKSLLNGETDSTSPKYSKTTVGKQTAKEPSQVKEKEVAQDKRVTTVSLAFVCEKAADERTIALLNQPISALPEVYVSDDFTPWPWVSSYHSNAQCTLTSNDGLVCTVPHVDEPLDMIFLPTVASARCPRPLDAPFFQDCSVPEGRRKAGEDVTSTISGPEVLPCVKPFPQPRKSENRWIAVSKLGENDKTKHFVSSSYHRPLSLAEQLDEALDWVGTAHKTISSVEPAEQVAVASPHSESTVSDTGARSSVNATDTNTSAAAIVDAGELSEKEMVPISDSTSLSVGGTRRRSRSRGKIANTATGGPKTPCVADKPNLQILTTNSEPNIPKQASNEKCITNDDEVPQVRDGSERDLCNPTVQPSKGLSDRADDAPPRILHPSIVAEAPPSTKIRENPKPTTSDTESSRTTVGGKSVNFTRSNIDLAALLPAEEALDNSGGNASQSSTTSVRPASVDEFFIANRNVFELFVLEACKKLQNVVSSETLQESDVAHSVACIPETANSSAEPLPN